MNYYIQCDPTRAEEIKETFRKKGIDVLDFSFADKTLVYCSIGGVVQYLPYSINLMHILYSHPDYKELELPVEPKFKVGDWIVNDYCTGKVIALTDDAYLLDSGQGIPFSCEHNAHLWTIEDAKDGDVLVTTKIRSCPFIYRKTSYNNRLAYYYAGIDGNGDFSDGCLKRTLCHFGPTSDVAPATKEQRDLLFKKMKEAGYEWDAEKKELKKIKPHYDIKNFHAGMPVLVRADNDCPWDYSVFSRNTGNEYWHFAVCNGVSFTQCIPFEGNEHLLGTTDPCDEQYINW